MKNIASALFGLAFTVGIKSAMFAAYAVFVMILWNAVVPDVFHETKPLEYQQSLLLCCLLRTISSAASDDN
jgi:uncharacterized membrane protein YphA (DoxX/SURF4 family)